LPTEAQVKKSVRKFFEDKGYRVIEDKFNVGFKPDIVAFKWLNEYEIDALAVECKGVGEGKKVGSKTVMDVAISQPREYQSIFPYVYLALPPISEEGKVKSMLETLRLGLIIVDKDWRSEEKLKPATSPRLIEAKYTTMVRQRLAALLTYEDVFGKNFDTNLVEPEVVHCYMEKSRS